MRPIDYAAFAKSLSFFIVFDKEDKQDSDTGEHYEVLTPHFDPNGTAVLAEYVVDPRDGDPKIKELEGCICYERGGEAYVDETSLEEWYEDTQTCRRLYGK